MNRESVLLDLVMKHHGVVEDVHKRKYHQSNGTSDFESSEPVLYKYTELDIVLLWKQFASDQLAAYREDFSWK